MDMDDLDTHAKQSHRESRVPLTPARTPRSLRLAALASLVVLFSALYVGYDVNQAVGQSRNLNELALPGARLLVKVQSNMQECRHLALYLMNTRDQEERVVFQQRLKQTQAEVQNGLSALTKLSLPGDGKHKMDELSRNWYRFVVLTSSGLDQPDFLPVSESGRRAQEFIDDFAENSAKKIQKAFVKAGFELVVLLLGTLQMISAISTNGQKRRVLESLRLMNQDLIVARAAAEESSKMKSEFLATVSHEIRTPMNGIIGMADLLSRTGLNEDQQSYNDTVRASAEALLTILNDILDFSRIEAGKMRIESAPFEVALPLFQMADLLAPAADQKGIEFLVRMDPNVPKQLSGDGGRIRQVLMNLAGNAIKFTDAGHVLIEAESLGVANGICNMRYAVHDTGIGIERKTLATLFEKFTQADASTTRKYGGTGLGLAISRRLVELMGGVMTVESELGAGSIFSFEVQLPVIEGAAAARPLAMSVARVLLVEPHEVSCRVFGEMLANFGAEYRTVRSGAEAVEILRADPSRWHVVLISNKIRTAEAGCFVSIQRILGKGAGLVLMAANGRVEKRDWLSSARVPHVISKACRPEIFEEALAVALRTAVNPVNEESPSKATHTADLRRLSLSIEESAGEAAVNVRTRVLVAEDNMVNQTIVRRLLEQAGCQVDVASNGRQAVSHWEEGRYSLIFMDCQMPELDGFEATREIRKREGGRERVPIVAITANVLDKDRSQCFLAGMDDFLSKPLRLGQLQEAVDRWTNRPLATAVSTT